MKRKGESEQKRERDASIKKTREGEGKSEQEREGEQESKKQYTKNLATSSKCYKLSFENAGHISFLPKKLDHHCKNPKLRNNLLL